ncbi:MAG TPA: ATPase [Anaerolineae bacterium]|nr:ATPase [Anaerolineae bacterium]
MIVLGVDAGGSKTHALLMDEKGHILGFGTGGPANHQVVGPDAALAEIEQAARDALARAGIAPPVHAAFFCLAGADLPVDFAMLQPKLGALGVARSVQLANDTLAGLRAGLSRSWGVAVVCGSGFNAGGIGPDGTRIQFPGLGTISGDRVGGHWMAMEAISRVMRAWDGRGQPTALRELVLDALGFDSEEAMLSTIYESQYDYYPASFDVNQIWQLTPLVFRAALQGDAVAQEIVVEVGEEVGTTANAILRRLGLEATDVEVVLSGSVFKGEGPLLLDTVTQVVHRVAPRARIKRPMFEPVVGAALLALESAGVEVDEAVYATLQVTAPTADG